MRAADVTRLYLGSFVRPATESLTGRDQVEAVYGYLVRHENGVLLLDTGIGEGDTEADAWYRPSRVPLATAMSTLGLRTVDIALVANCHLHFDHCGGNPQLAGTPIVVQRDELAVARAGDYTIGDLVDHAGVRYEELDGEAEVWPGVHVIPTPGHVDGHQSLVVECDDGSLVLAGQSHEGATQWGADALALAVKATGDERPIPTSPAWMERLLEFDPKRVYFAHDAATWEPGDP